MGEKKRNIKWITAACMLFFIMLSTSTQNHAQEFAAPSTDVQFAEQSVYDAITNEEEQKIQEEDAGQGEPDVHPSQQQSDAEQTEEQQTEEQQTEEQQEHPSEQHIEQEENEAVEALGQNTPNIFLLVLQIVFSLVIVIALIYIVVRFLSQRQKKMGHHHLVQNMGGTSLGQNKSVQVIKAGGNIYLVGVGDNVSLLKEVTDPAEIARLEQDVHAQETVAPQNLFTFLQNKWKQFRQQQKGEGPEDLGDPQESQSFQTLFEERLQKQRENREQMREQLQQSAKESEEGRYK